MMTANFMRRLNHLGDWEIGFVGRVDLDERCTRYGENLSWCHSKAKDVDRMCWFLLVQKQYVYEPGSLTRIESMLCEILL